MTELSIGQVAGIINVAVVITQLTFPLAVIFLLVGLLKESNNAVTWSVAGRLLNGSSWPTILRTDTASIARVSKRVVFFSAFSTAGLIFIGAVSVVTPLGLHEAISQTSNKNVHFGYVPDLKTIGRGTQARADYKANRLCGWLTSINCPGQGHGFSFFSNASGGYIDFDDNNAYMSSVIPLNITEVFSSGSQGSRNNVAGAFDIEYRSFVIAGNPKINTTLYPESGPDPNVDRGSKRTQGKYHTYESLILNDRIDLVEGLVVDTRVGGIGFRNHTVPLDPGKGSEWTEGLLWIEPETACVSTNLSIEYTIQDHPSVEDNWVLTDWGGISGLPKDYPYIDLGDSQGRPELYARAHKGAVLSNFNLRVFFNTTANESAIGKSYILNNTFIYTVVNNRLSIGKHVDNAPMIPSLYLGNGNWSPTSNTSDAYVAVGVVTRGSGGADNANISNIAVETGLILGTASRLDGGTSRPDPGSKWSAPLYSCATALKAYIMDVSFLINGTSLLENLQVTATKPRTYASNASTPLWAVEDTGMNIADVAPFWAIVDDKYESWPHLWTLRKDHLYLPAGAGSNSILESSSASASAEAPQRALTVAYGLGASSYSSSNKFPDYSGVTNYQLFLKWKELAEKPDTSATIVNLIWTDIMANYVLGTRPAEKSAERPLVRVRRFDRKIQYDMRYAIPGIIFSTMYAVMVVCAFLVWLFGRVNFQYLRTLLDQTATGRAVTVERHGDAARAPAVSTKKWIRDFGEEDLGFRNRRVDKKGDDESVTPSSSPLPPEDNNEPVFSPASASENNNEPASSPASAPENESLISAVERPLLQQDQRSGDVPALSANFKRQINDASPLSSAMLLETNPLAVTIIDS